MYTYTLGDILKKGFKTFFTSQFTAHSPTGKENKEVKDTSKLGIRVLVMYKSSKKYVFVLA